jgi:hypothetical protein
MRMQNKAQRWPLAKPPIFARGRLNQRTEYRRPRRSVKRGARIGDRLPLEMNISCKDFRPPDLEVVTMADMTINDLREAIGAAFASVGYPGDDHLTVYLATGREYDETFKLLRGKSWREFPVDFIWGDTPIPDLAPQAFHYYMPALLLASLDVDHETAGNYASSLLFFLSPSNARLTTGEFQYDHTENFQQRMAQFNRDQRNVMIRVLEEYVALGWATPEEIFEAVALLNARSSEG